MVGGQTRHFQKRSFFLFLVLSPSKILPTKCPLAQTFGLLRDQKSFHRPNIQSAKMPVWKGKGNVATTKRFALPRCQDVWHCEIVVSTFPSEAKYFSKMPEIINFYQYAGLPAVKSNKNQNFVNLSQQHQQNHITTKTYYFQCLQNSS